jgi:hypothetical protein
MHVFSVNKMQKLWKLCFLNYVRHFVDFFLLMWLTLFRELSSQLENDRHPVRQRQVNYQARMQILVDKLLLLVHYLQLIMNNL